MDNRFLIERRREERERIFEKIASIREEFRKSREEATKKYEEEMVGYSISSHVISPTNGNKPLVFTIPDLSSPDCCILDVSTKVFHNVSSPHLRDSFCLYNKGEWLLMCREEEACLKTYYKSLFLFNPHSGSRIDLPGPFEKGHFAFSLTCGNPCRVIHASCKIPTGGVVIRVIRPNDSAWEVHELDNSYQVGLCCRNERSFQIIDSVSSLSRIMKLCVLVGLSFAVTSLDSISLIGRGWIGLRLIMLS